jgi:hypothetical protein
VQVPKLREEIERITKTPMPRFTLSMVLQPQMKVRIRVGFMPRDYETRSTLLIVRYVRTCVRLTEHARAGTT